MELFRPLVLQVGEGPRTAGGCRKLAGIAGRPAASSQWERPSEGLRGDQQQGQCHRLRARMNVTLGAVWMRPLPQFHLPHSLPHAWGSVYFSFSSRTDCGLRLLGGEEPRCAVTVATL